MNLIRKDSFINPQLKIMRKLTYLTGLILMTAYAFGQDNIGEVIQSGINNISIIDQIGIQNTAYSIVYGNDNVLYQIQEGQSNDANLSITSGNNNIIDQFQRGANNQSDIDIEYADYCKALTFQDGFDLSATTHQFNGQDNIAEIYQYGNDHNGIISQTGSNNSATINQRNSIR